MNQELDIDEMRAEVNVHGVLDIDQATELLDRLEQAEQAVARVREVAAGWATNDRPFREALIRALGGDTRG